MSQFKDMLKHLRESRKMSQAELARELGVSTSSIGMYESGRRQPNFETEEKIAGYFNVSLNTLRGQDEESSYEGYNSILIPVLGEVRAGLPSDAVENILNYVLITTEMASTGDYFGLRIKGDSMEPLISDGDTVIVRKQSNADHGDIVIASIDKEDAVCKKFLKRANSITLLSVNSKYDPMEFNTRVKRSVSIIGKVVELRRSFV